MKIIVDAMGGDFAPLAPVKGALMAQEKYGVDIVLTGKTEEILKALQQCGCKELPKGMEIANATEVVEICDDPATAFKHKKDSSLTVGLNMLHAGDADGFVSAGSTGALLAGATLLVKRIRGLRRAALAPTIPTAKGKAVLIDCGANAECTVEYLLQFAYLGSYYAQKVLGVENPRIGLLNIGAEESKGDTLRRETYQKLKEAGEAGHLNFTGNIEAKEAMLGEFDVIVAAHGHKSIPNKMINGVLVVENKNAGATVSDIHVYLERGLNGKWKVKDRTSENLIIKDYAPDPELTALLAEYDQRAKDDAVTPIGQLVGGDLAPENEIDCLPQAMVQDTALLDFINEVQMYYTGAQVSATALTSMTSQMREGTIRKCDMASIYTYQNTLYKLQMNGWQLRQFMEWSAAFFKTWEPGDVTIAFDSSVRYYLYDAFAGVKYDLDISKQPGNRIQNLTWMDGRPVEDDDSFVVAVNNYRATTQLLAYADIFKEGDELPKLLEIDVRGDVGGIRELLGEYIRTVKGGTIEPHVDNNWKLVGDNWNAADHEKAVKLLREGKLALSENADSRTLPGKAITTADIAAF